MALRQAALLPERPVVHGDQRAAGEHPGNRVDAHQHLVGRHDAEGGQKPDDPEDDGAEDRDDGRADRVAHAAENAGRGVEEGAEPLDRHNMVHAAHGVVDGDRIRRVEPREFARPDRERQRQQLREQDGLKHREAENATAATVLTRAEVLTVEGYRRLRKRGADVISEVLEIEARGRTCDGLRTEAVDAGLNEDVRNREHRLLHARREANLQHALHVPRV